MQFEEDEGDEEDYEELKVESMEVKGGDDLRGDVFKKGKKSNKAGGGRDMNAPELIEELEEFFQSAHDHFVSTMGDKRPTTKAVPFKRATEKNNNRMLIEEEKKEEEEEPEDPPTRDVLPFFKDPKVKISLWAILKDSIGKDLSKITVPVYFNEPLSILQRTASTLEYIDLLDVAIAEENEIRRMAIAALYCAI